MKPAPYGRGAHVLRKPDRPQRKKAAPLPAREYPAGFFTELVVQHDWPPRFASLWAAERSFAEQIKASRAMRAAGLGFASVDLGLPGAVPYLQRWAKVPVMKGPA